MTAWLSERNALIGGHTASTACVILKSVFLILSVVLFMLNLSAFFSWSERRGVHDDICYLRQAHLFKRYGFSGIDTNIARDDDSFFRQAQRDIGVEHADDLSQAVCHTNTKTGKRVLQYPPGTGFVMSYFPEGSQVAWLFTVSMTVVMGATIFVVLIAEASASTIAAGLFGLGELYLMVNPTKASYSMAPTTALCIAAAILTSIFFVSKTLNARMTVAASIGILLGLAVSFRTANLLLVAGYVVVFGAEFLRRRDGDSFRAGISFAAGYSSALIPALMANYINAGSLFATTYGSQDVVPPDFTFSIVGEYLADLQGYLAIWAVGAAIWMARWGGRHLAPVAIVSVNLALNLGFFFTHPIYTPYYLMPIVTLALWAIFSQWLLERRLPLSSYPNDAADSGYRSTSD